MACLLAYHEIYFTDVPAEIDGGYCCIRLRMTERRFVRIFGPEVWNEYDVSAGRQAYGNILRWARFLGMTDVVYRDGTRSRHTHRLPWHQFEFFYDICVKEINPK